MIIDETERQELLATARRLVKETNFTAGLCLRLASDAEKAALEAERERRRIRDMSEQLRLTARGEAALSIAAPRVDNVIPFPRRNRRLA
jgi:hypothetical protein